MEDQKPIERTREHVEREYGDEKWPAVKRLIEAERRAEPDGDLACVLGRVARQLGRAPDRRTEADFVAGGVRVSLPPAAALGAAQGLLVEMIGDACTDATDLIVELGSGWGWHLLSVWVSGGPRRALYAAAELTEAGRAAAGSLAELDPQLEFRAVPFDYHEPRLDGLGGRSHAVVFTVHSIEQIPAVKPELFEAIRGVAERVTCLHFEPVGWQLDGHDGRGTSEAYARRHDYNRNLLDMVSEEAEAERLRIELVRPDVVGVNPDNATTVIRWRSPGVA